MSDELIDVGPSPSRLLGLPFPGRLVDGVYEVVRYEITHLSEASLQELCNSFRLSQMGNKAMLMERLEEFSADQKDWDVVLAGRRNENSEPRDGGVMRDSRKTGPTKQSTFFLSDTTNGTDSTMDPSDFIRPPDTRTEEEINELMAWAKRRVELNKLEQQCDPKHPLYKPPVMDATVPSPGHIENMPDSPVSPVMAMPKVDDGTGSMMTPCSLTDTSDMRTDEEKAELLAWAACSAARHSHYDPTHYLYKPPAMDTTVPSPGHIENMLDSPALPLSATVTEGPVAACRGSKLIDTTVDGTTTDRPTPLV